MASMLTVVADDDVCCPGVSRNGMAVCRGVNHHLTWRPRHNRGVVIVVYWR